ncbi:MAG: serine/threonine protein kinase [Ktedonobacteraceae bacterium]|nr:serine/threonine protein kinase [Ktedonobacteraceae bacterium]
MINAEALVGTVVGTCVLQRLIGQGGMGAVYLAQQSRPRRQVAVKVLLPMTPLSSDQLAAFLERFRRETDAAASLEHPNIVPVHEYGERSGLVYLVMPYISGGTLRDEMEREGPLALNKIINYLDQLAAALDFAHARGVIHRDIKPANILMTPEGRLFLTDFGLVKIVAEGQTAQVRLTGAGAPVGTPDYMSPEQVIGEEVDARADLYSLGVVLYQMVTGTTPFQGETPMQIAAQHLQIPPPAPQMLRPDLPVAAEQVILRALAKQPTERYVCAKDLAEAFRMAIVGPAKVQGSLRTGLFAALNAENIPATPDVFKQFGKQTHVLPSVDTSNLASIATMSAATHVALPPARVETEGRGLLSRTGRFPRMGLDVGQTPAVDAKSGESETMSTKGGNTLMGHTAGLPPQQRSALPLPGQISPAITTRALTVIDQSDQIQPKAAVKLTTPVKVVKVPIAGQPGRYLTGLLPVLPHTQEAESGSEQHTLSKGTKRTALVLSILLLLFSSLGVIWFVYAHSSQTAINSASTRLSLTTTAVAQATATVQANIILSDTLDHNTQNWLTTPPDVYAFKDHAYHVTDRGNNGRATVLQGHTFTSPLAYTLTMQEINGDDTSANNSFGMLLHFSQQTRGNTTVTTFYSFEVVNVNGGEYQFWKYDDSKGTSASPWTEIWHKPFGKEFHWGHGSHTTNTLKVFSDGAKFTFTVNEKNIATVRDGSFTNGTVGMIVNLNGTEVAFKNLLLTRN